MIRTRGLHAHVQSECVHTSAVKPTSLQVYSVPSLSQQHRQGSHRIQVHTKQYPQVPTFRLVPRPTLPNTTQHISHRMRFNELPQNTFSINTPLGDDVCNDSISVECPPPVDACSQRATKRDNAHQRHTRSVQWSSCAEGSFFS